MSQSVVVEETELADQPPALLVRPSSPASSPGGGSAVLWLHWLGHNRNDRTQFLAEAVRLAQQGVVSLLPQGVFPWHEGPRGDASDRDAVAAQARRTRAAYDAVAALPGVERVAVAAHDYGAMFGLTLRDVPIHAMVVAAPDATWDHWFRKYWHDDADFGPAYAEQFAEFDPLAGAALVQDRLLLQWAGKDEYVDPAVRDLFADAAPQAASTVYERYDHELGDRAVVDRLEFLEKALLQPS